MIDYRTSLMSLARRLVPAALLVAAAWFLVARAEGGLGATPQLLLAMLLLLVAALTLAWPLASLIAEPFAHYFHPDRPLDRPMPAYGIPESLRKRGLHDEAFAGFRAIALKYPQELKAYVEMIDVAIVDLHNRDLARSVLQQGRAALERLEDREALERLYIGISSRLDPRPTPPRPRLKG